MAVLNVVRCSIGPRTATFNPRCCFQSAHQRYGIVRVGRIPTPFLHRRGNLHTDVSKPKDLFIRHAIFGVGTPEALLVVVVALVVFGPKGLAEIAKSTGQMLRSFGPTIRELAEISTDLKSSLEQEIGLEEIKQDLQDAVRPSYRSNDVEQKATSSLQAETVDPDIEAKRVASVSLAWGKDEAGEEMKDTTTEGSAAAGETIQNKPLGALTIEELEEELAKRKTENKSA